MGVVHARSRTGSPGGCLGDPRKVTRLICKVKISDLSRSKITQCYSAPARQGHLSVSAEVNAQFLIALVLKFH